MADPIGSIPGVSSGVDWKTLVDAIIASERRPADALQKSIDANAKRKSALGDLGDALTALKTAADALKAGTSGAAFSTFFASSAGADVTGRSIVSVTASNSAVAGRWSLNVLDLAAAQKVTAGKGYASDAVLPTTGTLTLTLGRTDGNGNPITVDVPVDGTTNTLAKLRDAINAKNTGASASGVIATLVGVGPTDQRLVLTSAQTGVTNGFTLSDGGSGLLASLGLDPNGAAPPIQVAAKDASFTLDGLPMTRATNTVADALPGITMTFTAKGPATVDVVRNNDVATKAAKDFVDAYNKVLDLVKAQGAPGKPLAGDSLARSMRSDLASRMLGTAPTGGSSGVAVDLTTLAAAGISIQRDGKLTLDSSKFSSLAGTRLTELTAMLADRMGAVSTFLDTLAAPGTGLVDQREQGIEQQSARYQSRIDDITSRLDKRRKSLLAQYSKYEAALGKLQALQSSMSSQFAGLNKSSGNN